MNLILIAVCSFGLVAAACLYGTRRRNNILAIAAKPEVQAAAAWWATEMTICRQLAQDEPIAEAPKTSTKPFWLDRLCGAIFYPLHWLGLQAGNGLNWLIDVSGLDKAQNRPVNVNVDIEAFKSELAEQIATFYYQYGEYPVVAMNAEGQPLLQRALPKGAIGSSDQLAGESVLSVALRQTGFTGRSPFLCANNRRNIVMKVEPANPLGYPRQAVRVTEDGTVWTRRILVTGPIG